MDVSVSGASPSGAGLGPPGAVATGAVIGVAVGGLSAGVPGIVSMASEANNSTYSADGDDDELGEGLSLIEYWETAVAFANRTTEDGASRILHFSVSDFVYRKASIRFIGEDGTIYQSSTGHSDWGEANTVDTSQSSREAFDAADVSANLTTVAEEALAQGRAIDDRLTLLGVEIRKVDEGVVFDGAGEKRIVGARERLPEITVELRADPDSNMSDMDVATDGAGVFPAGIHGVADIEANLRRALPALEAAGIDPATLYLERYDSAVDSRGGTTTMVVEGDGRHHSMAWHPGGFVKISSRDVTWQPDGPRLLDFDPGVMDRVVEDARNRGSLDPHERDMVDIDMQFHRASQEFGDRMTAQVSISSDPDAAGHYGVLGAEAGRYLGPL